MASLHLTISGMTCGHCRMKVEKALKGTDGVYAAVVDLQAGSADVDFDDRRSSAAALITAVESAGYKATIAS